MNTDRGRTRTDRFGSGSGNRRNAWRTRPAPPYRPTASGALTGAWALLAGNASQDRYPRTRAARHHR
jgi:hypothetical protein